jgi:putative hydrolase of the HAD superfamily
VAAKAKLKAILFDIDDTLYSTTEFAERARRNAVKAMVAMGLRVSEEDAYRELMEVIAEFSANYDRHYDKLLRRFPAEAMRGVNSAVIVAAGVVAYHETKFKELRPFPDAGTAVHKLAEHTELVLGILTEGLEIKQAEKIVRLGLYPCLEPGAIFISDQVGISKPNPKLYRHALKCLGLGAGQVMYVGDNPLKDIVPAKEVGLVTVRCRRSGGKYRDLDSMPPADYEITSFDQLLTILAKDFGIGVKAE